jgi:hypothetical protein
MNKRNVTTRMVPNYQETKAHIRHKTIGKHQTL